MPVETIIIFILCLIIAFLLHKLWVTKDTATSFAHIVIRSTFVKYNGIVYHKTDYNEANCILIAGQSAYVEVLPKETKWEYSTPEEFFISESKLKTK